MLPPLSRRLNDYLIDFYETHKDKFIFVSEDDFNPEDIEGTLQKHIARYETTGKIHIWTGSSDNTIFGDPKINHYFRAWHDLIHITKGFGYDFIGESIVCDIQKQQLPKDWVMERQLVHCEIVGQAQYYMLHKSFVNNQRAFTFNYLEDCAEALNKTY